MTHDSRDARLAGPRADDGFTLIEVVVALVVLGLVATGALQFFLRATATASHLQRSQTAVAIANEAMERVHAVRPQDDLTAGAGVPGLVVGRAAADVTAAWDAMAARGVEGLDASHPIADPGAAAGSAVAVLPITYETTSSGQRYTVTTLVGTCFRDRAGAGGAQACGRLTGGDPGDAGTPATMVRMLRVVVAVTWEQGGQCDAGRCLYQLSSLVDRSVDATWNRVVEPIARPDTDVLNVSQSRVLDVLANDQLGPLGPSPVQVVTAPVSSPAGSPAGTATATSTGTIKYVAPAAAGTYTFTYRVKDARGAQSEPATVTVTVVTP